MNQSFFRGEVINAKFDSKYGSIALIYPVSNYLLLAAALAVLAGLLLAALCIDYTRYTEVNGVVEPKDGVIHVYAPRLGVLQASNVKDGQQIRKGQVMFVFASESADSKGHQVERGRSEALSARTEMLRNELEGARRLHRAKLAVQQRNLDALTRERQILEAEMTTQRKRVAYGEHMTARFDQLQKSGFVAESSVRQKQDELHEQEMRTQALIRQINQNESEREKLRLEIDSAPLQNKLEEQQIEKEISAAQLELQEQANRKEWSVIAPADGIVTSVLMTPSQAASASLLLATIVPAQGASKVHLYANSRSLGFVRPGQRVKIKVDAFPYQKFGFLDGVVESVSDSPILPAEAFRGNRLAMPAGSEEPVYTISVKPDRESVTAYGEEQRLRAGMQVSAHIQLDTRRLFEWIFEPLYSIRR